MMSARYLLENNDDFFWFYLNVCTDELRRDNVNLPLREKFVETAEIRENSIQIITALARRVYESVSRDDNLLKIEIVNRKNWENTGFDEVNGVYLLPQPTKFISLKPKRQAQLLTLLLKIYNLLAKNSYLSKRAIFYEEKETFKSQHSVDELIDDICCITLMKRHQLHIFPSSKGIIAGNVFLTIDDETFNAASFKHGFSLPIRVSEVDDIKSNAKFILLVEKESIFRRLLSAKLCEKMPIIMITGKGFPDSNTREMVNLLWQCLKIPILALVDADPYGIEILCIYKYGSLSLAFMSGSCVTRQIKWIGVHPSDICRLNVPESAKLPLKESDKAKLFDLSQRPYMRSNPEWADQLLILSKLEIKVETECFCSFGQTDYLTEVFIPQKIRNGGWI